MTASITILSILLVFSPQLPEGFIGLWKLVSIDGKANTTTRMTVRETDGIVHVETVVTDDKGVRTTRQRLVLDGQEYTEALNRSSERVTKTKWEKDHLRVSSKIRPKRSGPQDLNSPMASIVTYIDEKWSLSPDGSRLTVVSKMSGIVEGKTTTIYERE